MRYLHEGEEEAAGGVADGLFGVAEAVDDGGEEGVEMELEVFAGEDGGGGEGLERALGDPEVVVLEQIHARVHQRRHLRRRQPLPRRF